MKLRIRTYLILAFIFVSVIPLAVFWSWPYSRILEAEKAEVRERHLLIAENLASVLEHYHRDLVTALAAFRESIEAGRGMEARTLFRNLSFRHICVADSVTGVVRSSYLTEEAPCPAEVPAKRLALFRELAASSPPGVSRVFRPEGEKPRIFLASRSGDNLIVAAVYTDFFERLRRQVRFGEDGHAAIVDQTGGILAHPCSDTGKCIDNVGHLAPVERIRNGESGVAMFFSPIKQQQMIAGFAAVPVAGWGVMVPQPLSELEDRATMFNRDALMVLSLGVAFSLIMALVISLQLSRRLGQIAAAVHEVTLENDEAYVHPGGGLIGIGELQGLEGDVNRMARMSAESRHAQVTYSRSLEDTNDRLRREMDERHLAEEGKATSERRFRSLFENAPIPIREEDVSGIKTLIDTLNIPDPDAFGAHLDAHPEFLQACAETITVVDANRASLALHGYTDKNEMLSRVVRTLSPTSMQIVRRTVETIHAGLPGTSYETAITRTDGETRTVAATWSVMPGHETTYARILLTSVDITDRLASEAALRQAQKMEAVGQLTGGVAHDFNNLLTVIGGNAELLNETAELDPELTSPIVKAVRRGADLTQRLLAFSRNQPLEPKPLDLGELVGGMTELLQRSLGEEISVEIRNRNAGWLALADPGQVEAALLNMALNSRDAMPRGGKLTISIDDHTVPEGGDAQLAPGDYMVLSVCDTGTGMTRHTIDHAFEPFFTTKEVGKGSGLGLSMIYGFAKQSDGDARIQSELGAGSTVSLYLPRATSAGVRTATPAKDCGRAMGNGEQILVLEDDPEVRAYLLTLLEKQGYRSVPAEDARAARAMLADGHSFDLLISDVMLPGGVLGPEFAAEFVRERPGVPVLFISGRPSGPKLTELDGLADAPLISKPFERAEIAEKIASLLNPA